MSQKPLTLDEGVAPKRVPNRLAMLRAAIWAAGGFVLRQAIRLGGNLVFTRLLYPEAFGLMAIVNAFRVGLEMVSDIGIFPSIVRSERGDEPRFRDTAWTLGIVRGALLFAIIALVAAPLARLYDAPDLTWLLIVTGGAMLLAGFDSTSLSGLHRAMKVSTYERIELLGQITSVLTVLVWLLIEPTVWALVAGFVAQRLVRLALSFMIAERRDRFGIERAAFQEIFDFGKWILLSSLVTFLASQADRLILGRLATLSELGIFSIAAMLATMPSLAIHRVTTMVLFPVLSRSQDAGLDLHPVYRETRMPILAVGGLVVAAVAASGEPFIAWLYDERYHEAGWMLQFLALGAWFQLADAPARSILLTLGQSRWMPALSVVKMLGVLIGLPVGFALGGIGGGIAALVVADGLAWLVACFATHRQGFGTTVADLGVTVAVGLSAWIGMLAASRVGLEHDLALVLVSAGAAALAFTPVALVLAAKSRLFARDAA